MCFRIKCKCSWVFSASPCLRSPLVVGYVPIWPQDWVFKLKAWRDTKTPKGEWLLRILFSVPSGIAQFVLHPLFLACLAALCSSGSKEWKSWGEFGLHLPTHLCSLSPPWGCARGESCCAIACYPFTWDCAREVRDQTGALGAALPSWAAVPIEGLLPSSSVRPDQSLPTHCKTLLSPCQAFGNTVHSGTVILILIEKPERPILLLFAGLCPLARTSGSIAYDINFSFLKEKIMKKAVKKIPQIYRGGDGDLLIYLFSILSLNFSFLFFFFLTKLILFRICLSAWRDSGSFIALLFPSPHSVMALLIPLMQDVSVCQCNSGVESPVVLILQTLEILEVMNIDICKDSGEHCYQDQGPYWK